MEDIVGHITLCTLQRCSRPVTVDCCCPSQNSTLHSLTYDWSVFILTLVCCRDLPFSTQFLYIGTWTPYSCLPVIYIVKCKLTFPQDIESIEVCQHSSISLHVYIVHVQTWMMYSWCKTEYVCGYKHTEQERVSFFSTARKECGVMDHVAVNVGYLLDNSTVSQPNEGVVWPLN